MVQCVPSWLYVTWYLVTHCLVSCRPFVTIFLIFIGRLKSTLSHWWWLLWRALQAPLYRPRLTVPSLDSLALWYLSHSEEAVICLFLIAPLFIPKALLQTAAVLKKNWWKYKHFGKNNNKQLRRKFKELKIRPFFITPLYLKVHASPLLASLKSSKSPQGGRGL